MLLREIYLVETLRFQLGTLHANLKTKKCVTRACVCVSGGKKCSLFGKFGVFCFLETPVLRFALLSYYGQTVTLPSEIINTEI